MENVTGSLSKKCRRVYPKNEHNSYEEMDGIRDSGANGIEMQRNGDGYRRLDRKILCRIAKEEYLDVKR